MLVKQWQGEATVPPQAGLIAACKRLVARIPIVRLLDSLERYIERPAFLNLHQIEFDKLLYQHFVFDRILATYAVRNPVLYALQAHAAANPKPAGRTMEFKLQ